VTVSLELHAAAPPLETSADGAVRVVGTRIKLDVVVREFDAGASAEDLVLRFPTLTLSDTYAVLAFVLRERAAVDAYLAEREAREATSLANVPGTMTRIRDRLQHLRDERS
jgi:uncharacterized protein (DUF433 family)